MPTDSNCVRALLVHMRFQKNGRLLAVTDSQFADSKEEFVELCCSAGAKVVEQIGGSRFAPDPKYFIGRGKVDDIAMQVVVNQIELVIFNHSLSPVQERNLEQHLQCRVVDRTRLILDIFAKRAHSFEGKLQVELAQLRYLSTRLIRGWSHLERQKGGIGLRGPGETQLETDRRLIAKRIKKLSSMLDKTQAQREQGRRYRKKLSVPSVALVGYTNAGKSTLFNRLTANKVYVADQLFATLDPTVRRLESQDGFRMVLADTVGFIRDLPHDLIAAFHSTLTEVRDADLLLHVVDASRDDREECIAQVNQVLAQISPCPRPVLMVYNKIDLLGWSASMDHEQQARPTQVRLSSRTAKGIDLLKQALSQWFRHQKRHGWVCLAPDEARLRAKLYASQVVQSESCDHNGHSILEVNIHDRDLHTTGLVDRLMPVIPDSLA